MTEITQTAFYQNLHTTWDLFKHDSGVLEVRALLKSPGKSNAWEEWGDIISGYFDNYDAFAERVTALERSKQATGVYVTLNPVMPALLGRAKNRLIAAGKKAPTTSDDDIISRRALLIDADPYRPAGLSSTQAEMAAAIAKADEVAAYLYSMGFPSFYRANSGNGAHLVGRIDLPNDNDSNQLIGDFLECLNWKFGVVPSDKAEKMRQFNQGIINVGIDTTVKNASRITKLYGTAVRKGDDTDDRPHRDAAFTFIPDQVEVIPAELIEVVAQEYRDHKAAQSKPLTFSVNGKGHKPAADWSATADNFERWMAEHGVTLGDRDTYTNNGWSYKWSVDCLTSGGAHKDGAEVFWGVEKLGYKCHHDSCNGKDWNAVRSLIAPKSSTNGRDDYDGFSPNAPAMTTTSPGDERKTPAQYVVYGGRISYVAENKDGPYYDPLADFDAKISEELTDEHGNTTYVITGKGVRGGAFRFEIEADVFEDKIRAALSAASAYDGIVPGRYSSHLGRAIKTLSTDITRRRSFARTGWNGDKFLIPGREPEGIEIKLDQKAAAYDLGNVGELAQGVKALEALIDGVGNFGTVIAAHVLLPPLAQLCGWRNLRYGLFLRGITGSLKTTTGRLAMAVWGRRFATEELFEKAGQYGATTNGIMGRSAEIADLPFMIDNFKPNTQGRETPTALIHGIMEGHTKSRAGRGGENAPTRPIHCWPLMTGEDSPGNDVAAMARLVIVDMPSRGGIIPDGIDQAGKLSAHLSAIGAAWLDLLENDGERIAKIALAEFERSREEYAAHIRLHSPNSENILRSATNLALNAAAWAALAELPALKPLVCGREGAHRRALYAIGSALSEHTGDQLEAVKFLAAIGDLLSANRVQIQEKETVTYGVPVIGWRDDYGNVNLIVTIVRQQVDMLDKNLLNGISMNAIYKQMETLDVIAEKGEDKTTKVKWNKFNKTSPRVLVLKPEALAPGGEQLEVLVQAKELGL